MCKVVKMYKYDTLKMPQQFYLTIYLGRLPYKRSSNDLLVRSVLMLVTVETGDVGDVFIAYLLSFCTSRASCTTENKQIRELLTIGGHCIY